MNDKLFESRDCCEKFYLEMFASFSRVVGFMREVYRGLWSFYGPCTRRLIDVYFINGNIYQYDRVGLKLASIMVPAEKIFDTLLNNYFTEVCEARLQFNPTSFFEKGELDEEIELNHDDQDCNHFASLISDFFLIISDLITDESDIHNTLFRIIQTFPKSEWELTISTDNYYRRDMIKQMIDYTFVTCPMNVSEFLPLLNQITKDENLIETFFDDHMMIDKNTKVCQLNQKTKDGVKPEMIDLQYMWYITEFHSQYSDSVQFKIPQASRNPLHINLTSTQYFKLLSKKFLDSKIWERLDEFANLFHSYNIMNTGSLTSLLRLLNLLFSSIEESDRERKVEVVGYMRSFIDTLSNLDTSYLKCEPVILFKGLIERYTMELEGEDEREEFSIMPIKRGVSIVNDITIRDVFNMKKKKLFERSKMRREKYFETNHIKTEGFIQTLAEKNDQIMCVVEREALTDEKTYFMYSTLHMSTVE